MRTVQAFSIIGGIVKILGTVSFISGRFAARTAVQALTLLDKGRALNLGFLLCNLLGKERGMEDEFALLFVYFRCCSSSSSIRSFHPSLPPLHLVTSVWASLPEDAFFFFCNVYPQQEGANSCITALISPSLLPSLPPSLPSHLRLGLPPRERLLLLLQRLPPTRRSQLVYLHPLHPSPGK